ncbi:hypothetical protein [Cohnella hongkongensis]|uniref:Uncharacterized protein n=1 Tax=Cohnella hongkongensis TaxID=178337 RepID=A0ABV9F5U8_9BACL
MEEMYHVCRSYMNRRVRVQTNCGACYEGVIVDVDRENVYLRTSGGVRISGWFGPGFGPGYGAGILALSLFTLLAIFLI